MSVDTFMANSPYFKPPSSSFAGFDSHQQPLFSPLPPGLLLTAHDLSRLVKAAERMNAAAGGPVVAQEAPGDSPHVRLEALAAPPFRAASTGSNLYVDFSDTLPEDKADFVSALATEAAREPSGGHERNFSVSSEVAPQWSLPATAPTPTIASMQFPYDMGRLAQTAPDYGTWTRSVMPEPGTVPRTMSGAEYPLYAFDQTSNAYPMLGLVPGLPVLDQAAILDSFMQQAALTAASGATSSLSMESLLSGLSPSGASSSASLYSASTPPFPQSTVDATSTIGERPQLTRKLSTNSSSSTDRVAAVAPILLEMHREGSGDLAVATGIEQGGEQQPRRSLRPRAQPVRPRSPSFSSSSDEAPPSFKKQRSEPTTPHKTNGPAPIDHVTPKTLASASRTMYGVPPSSLTPAQLDNVVSRILERRGRNTEAARRSRGRKREHLDWMETRVKELEGENEDLKGKLDRLECFVKGFGRR